MQTKQATTQLPNHVAIVMDGNGRWATQRGKPRVAGHKAGAQTARAIVETAARQGVRVLTLFAFSSENWNRPQTEVQGLMGLFMRTMRQQLAALDENNVQLRFIGYRGRLSKGLQKQMAEAEAKTQHNDGLTLVVALNYGGQWDIVQAAQALAKRCADGQLAPQDITTEQFASELSLEGIGAPELFIRTGGERRISNFLLWDLAYSELYFTDVLWPDFGDQDLAAALEWFASRERRFGRIKA